MGQSPNQERQNPDGGIGDDHPRHNRRGSRAANGERGGQPGRAKRQREGRVEELRRRPERRNREPASGSEINERERPYGDLGDYE
jgi:hypothetical protein